MTRDNCFDFKYLISPFPSTGVTIKSWIFQIRTVQISTHPRRWTRWKYDRNSDFGTPGFYTVRIFFLRVPLVYGLGNKLRANRLFVLSLQRSFGPADIESIEPRVDSVRFRLIEITYWTEIDTLQVINKSIARIFARIIDTWSRVVSSNIGDKLSREHFKTRIIPRGPYKTFMCKSHTQRAKY